MHADQHFASEIYLTGVMVVILLVVHVRYMFGLCYDQGIVGASAAQRPVHYPMRMCHSLRCYAGHAWTSDYGNPDVAEDFAYIHPYSPIHNVRPPTHGSKQYPAMIITTGDHDDRVVPLHSHKLTATLQHVLAGYEGTPQRNPLITRIDVRAGHGAGKPTKKVIEEAADSFGFAAKVVGAKWIKD